MTDIIKTAQEFYATLAQNNSKDWWQENRGTYDNTLKPFAQSLLEAMAPKLKTLSDTDVTTKLFRPHRDVRFSKDKTPYKTNVHMMWRLTAEAPQSPVFFFGIGLDYVMAGAGMMGFDKPVLENWRKFADMDHARLTGILDGVAAKGFAAREPQLKRIPSTYEKDHPGGELLRRKGLIMSKGLGHPNDLEAELFKAFSDLWPVNDLLISIAEA